MDIKLIRKQIRNVLQEGGANEVIKVASEQAEALIVKKMDEIEKVCVDRLTEMDKRAKAIQGFIVGEVKNNLETRLLKVEDLVDATISLLSENGISITKEAVQNRVTEIATAKVEEKMKQIETQAIG